MGDSPSSGNNQHRNQYASFILIPYDKPQVTQLQYTFVRGMQVDGIERTDSYVNVSRDMAVRPFTRRRGSLQIVSSP